MRHLFVTLGSLHVQQLKNISPSLLVTTDILYSLYSNLVGYPSTTTGALPNPAQAEFFFPELVELKIFAETIMTESLNILNYLGPNSISLKVIEIGSDGSITTIPTVIGMGLPKLTTFRLEGSVIQQNLSFNFGPTVQTVKFYLMGRLSIGATTPIHTNLEDLYITFILPSSESFLFEAATFPKLYSLTLYPNYDDDNILLDVAINAPISILTLSAYQYTVNLLTQLTSFTNLHTLIFTSASFTEFPLSAYPNSLKTIQASSGNLTTFPNVPLSLTSYQFPNNKLQGTIPWNRFDNTKNIIFNVKNNPLITTTSVPQSFCSNRLFISGCPSITTVPECFLCYRLSPQSVQTDVIPGPNFQCNIALDSTMIYTVMGKGNVTGSLIGYGNTINNRYLLRPIIPNKYLQFTDTLKQVGPPRTIELTLDAMYPSYAYNFTVLEIGIDMLSPWYRQLPTGVVQFVAYAFNFNSYLPHTFKINGRIDCIVDGAIILNTYFNCNTTGLSFKRNDIVSFSISNGYFSQDLLIDIAAFYPSNVTLFYYDSLIKVGSNYIFNGEFGNGGGTLVVYFNGDPSICTVMIKDTDNVQCTQTKYWSGIGLTNITISVDGFWSAPILANLSSLESLCNTTGCSGHGTCDENGNCVCNTGYYSDKCSEKYPTFRSGEYDLNDRKLISIYGDFGPFNQTIVSITLNNTDCQVTYKSQSLINCTLVSEPTDGLALVRLTVDNSTNNGNNWIYFKPSQSQGSGSGSDSDGSGGELTYPFNCYGHGQCINGKCKCDSGYSSIDNCLTKTSNHTNTPNTTSPTTSFDIDGIDFQFEMIAIQEIDTDDNIINEVLTNSWSSTILTDNQTQTTTVNYQLNNSDTTTTTALVTATISFSQQPRDIQFGSQLLHIDANSIKLSVNISNWTFNTFLTTLRVIFKTTINNDQSIEFDCQDVNIDTLTYEQLSESIQYLRVVKDNIQFTGRFIDYVLSDGRPTFSRTSIVNKTDDSNDQSTILIGISMPQSSESILDPDFTPLLNNKSSDSGCDSKSNTWRIIVGVVVGVSGAVAIGVASIILIKKKRIIKRHNKNMQHKLSTIYFSKSGYWLK
ncbi:hypothetical protein DFA_09548 [Cavenderia fasciculata]|uniref:EGF-like domain-containing protein n=1 Tax=Cavenderia fasciculata TaxID=261658 RepID=F4Q7X9_CACFS|nr:uncharacterized protein DFA_09548 [Cavenderia fasciculata]EGG15879.1 hypothetical protein DFA_09548 [Cavenderia fasciculata]|eukprot:XP_004352204.1 hypothetical protein DFA_09548 [Cavenderia fasciculata]